MGRAYLITRNNIMAHWIVAIPFSGEQTALILARTLLKDGWHCGVITITDDQEALINSSRDTIINQCNHPADITCTKCSHGRLP